MLIHPGSGLVFYYQKLANMLKEPISIYAMNNPYFGNDEASFDSLEEMTAYYATVIRNQQFKEVLLLVDYP